MRELSQNRISEVALSLLVVLCPFIVGSILMFASTGKTLLDTVPYSNDETFHWHQSNTFRVAGFDGGYYTTSEVTSGAGWGHFYDWGSFYPALYGSVGRVAGWSPASFALINNAAFFLAALLFIHLARLSPRQKLIFALALAVFIPFQTFMFRSMLQVMHQAIALVIAGIFAAVFSRQVSGRFVILSAVFMLLAGLMRPTWALMLLPLFVLSRQKRSWRVIAVSLAIAVPAVLLVALIFESSGSPYPHFRKEFFENLTSPTEAISGMVAYIRQSLIWMSEGFPHVMGQRLQILLLLLALIGVGGWQFFQQRRKSHPNSTPDWQWEIAFHLYNLLVLYILNIALHESVDSRGYRVMAPHLLISLMLFISQRNWRFVAGLIVSSIMIIPITVPFYNEFTTLNMRRADEINAQMAAYVPQFEAAIPYDADAESAWCNTVTMSSWYPIVQVEREPGFLLSMQPGIGLSWVHWYLTPEEFKAKYMLLSETDVTEWADRLNLRSVRDFPGGTLYINEDSLCEE
ncbi:MAG: hypothetical protein ACPG7F_08980 [Aggregatilineales bacterium]